MNDTTTKLIDTLRSAQDLYNEQSADSVNVDLQVWSNSTIILLSGLVLAFILIALILSTILLFRKQAKASEVLKVFGILSIIGLSTLLLITGYSNEQLTPIVGLFGAISGYLLGKDSEISSHEQSNTIANNINRNNESTHGEDETY